MASTFGELFRVTTFGESHGKALGAVIDGCPAGITISEKAIQEELQRRRPAQSPYSTPRKESDTIEMLAGIEEGRSLGSPIALLIKNHDIKPQDYPTDIYRPSHADYTTEMKYGLRSKSGGGRASARETVARVAAGAIAKILLKHFYADLQIIAYVESMADLHCDVDPLLVSPQDVESSVMRCPDKACSEQMTKRLEALKEEGDSAGGIIAAVVHGMPVGLGEPVFDKLEADLGKALLGIPACKGFEIGSGFAGSKLYGSQHNDAFYSEAGHIRTRKNHSGGIQGGISNGQPLYMRAAFKPVASIAKAQESINRQGESVILRLQGRHDPCVLPRAVVIVEAMIALVLADHSLRQMIFKH